MTKRDIINSDKFEDLKARYISLDEDIANIEEHFEELFPDYDHSKVEEFNKRLHNHERKRKDLMKVKDMLDDLLSVTEKAYKVFRDSERAPLPGGIGDDKTLNKASTLLGEPGECPVCHSNVDRNMLDARRKELKRCAADFGKAMRGEEAEMKVIKEDREEITYMIGEIRAKRRRIDEIKRDMRDMSIKLEDGDDEDI